MALTEEERNQLDSLDKAELIDMVGNLREQTAEVRAKAKQEVINKFLNGKSTATTAEKDEDEEYTDVFDLEENKAFNRLKKKFNNR